MIMQDKIKRYKRLNIKLTPQRIAILDYLEGNKSHPSAEQVYRHISKQFPSISYATVYNVLNVLVQLGFIKELSIDPDKKRFDPDTSQHHHLICVKCKKIIDVNMEYHFDLPGEALNGFKILSNQIEFYGICPDCLKKDMH
jgi:Fur family peroxide stress response transcriptional regulator